MLFWKSETNVFYTDMRETYKKLMSKIPARYKHYVEPYDIRNITGSSLWASQMYEGPVGDPHRMLVRTLFRNITTNSLMPLYYTNIKNHNPNKTGKLAMENLIRIAEAITPPNGIQQSTWKECKQWFQFMDGSQSGIEKPIRLMPFLGVRKFVGPIAHVMAMTMNDQLTELRKLLNKQEDRKSYIDLYNFLWGEIPETNAKTKIKLNTNNLDLNIRKAFEQRNALFDKIGKNHERYINYGALSEYYLTDMQPWGMVMSDIKQASGRFPILFRQIQPKHFRVPYPVVAARACNMKTYGNGDTMFQQVLSWITGDKNEKLLDILLRAPHHVTWPGNTIMMPDGDLQWMGTVENMFNKSKLKKYFNVRANKADVHASEVHEHLCKVLLSGALHGLPKHEHQNVANTLRAIMASIKWDYWYRDVSPLHYGRRMRADGSLKDAWNPNYDVANPGLPTEIDAAGRSMKDRQYAQFYVRMSLAWLSITWENHKKLNYVIEPIHLKKIYQRKRVPNATASPRPRPRLIPTLFRKKAR